MKKNLTRLYRNTCMITYLLSIQLFDTCTSCRCGVPIRSTAHCLQTVMTLMIRQTTKLVQNTNSVQKVICSVLRNIFSQNTSTCFTRLVAFRRTEKEFVRKLLTNNEQCVAQFHHGSRTSNFQKNLFFHLRFVIANSMQQASDGSIVSILCSPILVIEIVSQ